MEENDEHDFSYDCDCPSCQEYFIDLEADRLYEDLKERESERQTRKL